MFSRSGHQDFIWTSDVLLIWRLKGFGKQLPSTLRLTCYYAILVFTNRLLLLFEERTFILNNFKTIPSQIALSVGRQTVEKSHWIRNLHGLAGGEIGYRHASPICQALYRGGVGETCQWRAQLFL